MSNFQNNLNGTARSDSYLSSAILKPRRQTICRPWILILGLSGLSSGMLGCVHPQKCGTCIPSDHSMAAPQASLLETTRCVDPAPGDAIPAPPGTYVRQWSDAMGSQAATQQQIITRNLWFNGSEELGPDGQERLIAVAESLQTHPHLVLIEEEPIEIESGQTYTEALDTQFALNSARQANVIAGLNRLGHPDAENWVKLTSDRSVGVRGIEAPIIFNQQFNGGGIGGRRGGGGGMMVGGMMGGGMMGGGMMGGGMMGGGIF